MRKTIYITLFVFFAGGMISVCGQDIIFKDAGATNRTQVSAPELRSGKSNWKLPAVLHSPDTAKRSSLPVVIKQADRDSVRPSTDSLQLKTGLFRWRAEKNVKKGVKNTKNESR